jgi:hypothetical protein
LAIDNDVFCHTALDYLYFHRRNTQFGSKMCFNSSRAGLRLRPKHGGRQRAIRRSSDAAVIGRVVRRFVHVDKDACSEEIAIAIAIGIGVVSLIARLASTFRISRPIDQQETSMAPVDFQVDSRNNTNW